MGYVLQWTSHNGRLDDIPVNHLSVDDPFADYLCVDCLYVGDISVDYVSVYDLSVDDLSVDCLSVRAVLGKVQGAVTRRRAPGKNGGRLSKAFSCVTTRDELCSGVT